METNARLVRMLELAEAAGLDALALMPGPNLRYVSGLDFFISERPIVALFPVDDAPAVILPELEAGKAHAAGIQAFTYTDEEGYALSFHEACARLELAEVRVGIETLRMRMLEARILQRYIPGLELTPVDDLFSELRMAKDPGELVAMRQSIAVAEGAFKAWLPQLRVGMTEREAAARLVAALLSGGADALSFDPIVAGGPNGGLPHAVPGDRPFAPGDWVVVDWGAFVAGYASDITRMVVFGEPSGKLGEIYEIVRQANAAGRQAVAPGIAAEDVDAATRRVIEVAGYGAEFNHRTGHGLGMEIHEAPFIVAGNPVQLRPGMTFTVEPGIYIAGLGGIRIEDDMVVTEQGGQALTTLSREPFCIPGSV
ncbi:MAG: aminopeptidase P family protein [Anaerolineae bacterium]|nr:aminopeptidase P family protein [Anaerolineae bacterium]